MAKKRRKSQRRRSRSVNGLGAFHPVRSTRSAYNRYVVGTAESILGRNVLGVSTKLLVGAAVGYFLWKNRMQVQSTVQRVASKVGISVPPVFGPPASLRPPTGVAGLDFFAFKKSPKLLRGSSANGSLVRAAVRVAQNMTGSHTGPTATRGVPTFATAQAIQKAMKNRSSSSAVKRVG